MTSVLVTGSDGLLGWHLRCFLSTLKEVKVLACNRTQFNDATFLAEAVKNADVVVHLAGMNRGDEQEVARTNVALADQLVAACTATQAKPHVLFSSSTHADGQSSYGVSKRTAHEHLETWSKASGAAYCNLILPHIFWRTRQAILQLSCIHFRISTVSGTDARSQERWSVVPLARPRCGFADLETYWPRNVGH